MRARSVPARLAFLLLLAGIGACEVEEREEGAAEAALPADSVALVVGGLMGPESAVYDPLERAYLVTNINGDPLAEDDNGFISRIAPDGQVQELRWIDGADPELTLHAPKGITVGGDTLYVADVGAIRLFDRESGTSLGSWPVPGSTFLNDVALGEDGLLYATDSGMRFGPGGVEQAGTAAVYRFGSIGTPEIIAQGANLNSPNGIAFAPEGILIAPFTGNTLMRLTPTNELETVAELPAGQLDGLLRLDDGTLLVSSWEGGAVYRVDPQGNVTSWVEGLTSPADLGYDLLRRRVLIPLLNENQLRIQTLPR